MPDQQGEFGLCGLPQENAGDHRDRNHHDDDEQPYAAPAALEDYFSLFVVAVLWLGFSMNYAATRDIYFTVAIAHVLAEAPFLLRMI